MTNNEVNEADLAADYIEELLDITDFDGDIELGEKNGRPYVSIVSEDKKALDQLVGEKGETLQALQYLTRLSVGEQNDGPVSLLLDINGWREQRVKELKELAQETVKKLAKEDKIELEHMNSYERKIVHDYIKEEGAFSYSEGAAKERHVVVVKEEPQTDNDEN